MTKLVFVKDISEITHSLNTFKQHASNNKGLAISICKATTYWVHDDVNNCFGPAKFVGFKQMNFNAYKEARANKYDGVPFNGGRTRLAIEKVLDVEFTANIALEKRLVNYISSLLGHNVLNNLKMSKWKFITLKYDKFEKGSSIHNRVLLKSVGKSQFQDGVRIDKQFHDEFNPPSSPEYVPKGKARKIRVEFNGKLFDAEYRYEGTNASVAVLQRIQFYKELKDEFKTVFPQAKGFFTIRLGKDLSHFIFSYDMQNAQEYTEKLEDSVERSKRDGKQARQARLTSAQQRPDIVQVTSVAYIRNADVIVEVLERASGICEQCNEDAPFKRKKDGTPYLEVHHRIPLSEGGFDTVGNAIAVCPNCHRELHYG